MTEKLVFTVPGMSCANCEAAVGGAVSELEGISGVVVDLETKRVEVWGEALDESAIRAAIDDAGYEVA
jgi:copper chaperone